MRFEIKDRDAAGRICKLHTKNGIVKTPNLMPVINPNKMIISPREMKKLFGTEIVITNSYIIKKNEKLREKALEDGVHKLIDFDGSIMTDSGTFQSYVYGNLELDPIEIVEFQNNIGSDIGTILDVFIDPKQTREYSKKGVKETIKRAKLSVKVKGEMALACTVQGSIYPDIRKKCAEELSKIDADFFPIGGVVPLMENQRYSDLINCILASKKGLDPSRPVHLFGAGHPIMFPLAVALGCDLFDSSSYVKYACDGRMIFPWGTEKLNELNELFCYCPVCSNYDLFELRNTSIDEKIKLLSKHNLYICYSEIKKIRNSILNGNLWELVERRANSNPFLLEAMRILRSKEIKSWLEKYEPISKNRALFYTGDHTIHRPILYRFHNRLIKRYCDSFRDIIVFPEVNKPYSKHYSKQIEKIINQRKNTGIIVNSNIGPIPIELDEMYPLAQSVFPKIVDKNTEKEVIKIFKNYIKNKEVLFWENYRKINRLSKLHFKSKENIDFRRISAIADMQFGKNVSKILFNGDIKIIKSKKTGKIRNIYSNHRHILSMRAGDGMFTLKIAGAELLHCNLKYPNLRVIVKDDAVPYISQGKSVFAKFVIDCDPILRPFDECIIVDDNDQLIAAGRCILNKDEMLSFNYGVAVKTREYSNNIEI